MQQAQEFLQPNMFRGFDINGSLAHGAETSVEQKPCDNSLVAERVQEALNRKRRIPKPKESTKSATTIVEGHASLDAIHTNVKVQSNIEELVYPKSNNLLIDEPIPESTQHSALLPETLPQQDNLVTENNINVQCEHESNPKSNENLLEKILENTVQLPSEHMHRKSESSMRLGEFFCVKMVRTLPI